MLLVCTIERREKDVHIFSRHRTADQSPTLDRKQARAIGRGCVEMESMPLYLSLNFSEVEFPAEYSVGKQAPRISSRAVQGGLAANGIPG